MTFYRCSHCGNIITFMENKGVPVICCGEPMKELIPGSTDAAQEKHVPVILTEETRVRVSVGTAAHPMTAEHSIQWIALETDQGVSLRCLLQSSRAVDGVITLYTDTRRGQRDLSLSAPFVFFPDGKKFSNLFPFAAL